MKVIEAINRIDELKPNTIPQPEKIRWLSVLDGQIKSKIIDTHEGGENIKFNGYDNNSLETELLVPFPYDELYVYYLESKIDYANGEMTRYNISATNYNASYFDFETWYHKTHKTKSVKFKYW